MNEEQVYNRVARVFDEQGYPVQSRNDRLSDLDLDSLDKIGIIVALEDEFDIEIDDEEAEKSQTIGDIVDNLVSVLHGR